MVIDFSIGICGAVTMPARWCMACAGYACRFYFLVCLFAVTLASIVPTYALGEAMSGSGFIICNGHAFWLGRDRRFVYAMLLSTGIGMMMMTGILTAEMLIEGQRAGGLHGLMVILCPATISPKLACQPLCDGGACCWW